MASTYTPIATTTGNGSSGVVTFNSISGSYTDLILIANARLTSSTASLMTMRFNNDSGTNYSFTALYGTGTAAGSNRASSQTGTLINGQINYIPSAANTFFYSQTNVLNYSNATTYKTLLTRTQENGTEAIVGLWRSTSAITRIDLLLDSSGVFTTDSTFTLWGILNA